MYAYIHIILIYYIFQRQIHFILIHKYLVNFTIQHLFINVILANFINFFLLVKPNGHALVNLKLIIVIEHYPSHIDSFLCISN